MRAILPTTLLLALLLATPSPAAAAPEAGVAAVDADWILQRLARPAPMRTAFVELRESRLLKSPLHLRGEYRRPAGDVLVREVRSPYAETTTIEAGEAVIERAGKAPRRFPLSRAPELDGLQASFGALLSGDRQALEQHYRVAAEGTRQRWVLTLDPRQAGEAAPAHAVTLYGRGAELRCIETRGAEAGAPQRTLLAGAAADAAQMTDPAALAALCHGDGPATP